MLDIRFIIENKQSVEKKLTSMGESLDFDLIEKLFQERKQLILKMHLRLLVLILKQKLLVI